MTSLSSVRDTFPGLMVIFFSLLLLLGTLSVVIHVLRQRRRAPVVAAAGLLLLLAFFVFSVMIDEIFISVPHESWRVWSAFVPAIHDLPWLYVAGTELLLAVALCFFSCDGRRYVRAHLSPESIKEAVDLLPVGICISEQNGVPVLVNLKMNAFARAAAGDKLTDANALWKRVCEIGQAQNGQRIIAGSDGGTLLFAGSDVRVAGKNYRQMMATDVTEQYCVTAELQAKNERLTDIQRRFKALGEQNSAMIFEQETLNTRIAVHDELGQVLLLGRYYLEHPESADGNIVWRMLRQTNTVFLRDVEENDDVGDVCADALRMAGDIGVKVAADGELPASGAARELLGRILHECVINAAKHAEADELNVKLSGSGEALTVEITNNGLVPKSPIRESGGLKSMRRTIESAGGSMEVRSVPVFRLTIRIPM